MRTCLACGYDLSGHGEEPRCPECGLLNIPDGYRRQVWELVDSGKWFFSGPFQFFRKRPPGWWWALDRPDDLRRAVLFLVKNAIISGILIFVSVCVASSTALEVTLHYRVFETDDPDRKTVYETDDTYRFGWAGVEEWWAHKQPAWNEIYSPTRTFTVMTTSRVVIVRNALGFLLGAAFVLWVFLVWAMPAYVGLVTQLRKGLPSFARPPLTILAASAYESHRLVYNAVALVAALSVGSYLGTTMSAGASVGIVPGVLTVWLASAALPAIVVCYAAAGWIGPLRTDYTKQLIRSRFHAGRIIVMYAILLPAIFTAGLVSLVLMLVNDW